MAYKLYVTEIAARDLDGIISYILSELHNEQAAVNLLKEIERRYDILEENPHIYPMCQQILLAAQGYHKVIINGYILIIRIDKEAGIVYIERFFSRLEDYAEKL